MDRYTPPDPVDAPDGKARLEDDFVRPLSPLRTRTGRRLPAAVPLAMAGLLVVASLAFGATVVRTALLPAATPVVVADETDPPTAAPSHAPSQPVGGGEHHETAKPAPTGTPDEPDPTAEPTATAKATPKPTEKPHPTSHPTNAPPTELGLGLAFSEGKVRVSWTRYAGAGFDYYKVVRSRDTAVSWPADGDDTLVAAISDQGQLSVLDAAPKGKTSYYRVFAVESAGDWVTLASSVVKGIAVPGTEPTPGPVQNLGNLTWSVAGETYTFSWPRYTGEGFTYYKLVHGPWGSQPSYPDFNYWAAYGDPAQTSWSGCIEPGDYAVRLQVVDYSSGSPVIRAQTNIVHVVVGPAATPKPTTRPSPVSLSLSAVATADGVKLTWSRYAGDGFQFYKVVRSETNASPTYPENSGTSLVQAISDQGVTAWTDTGVVAGHTYHFRVVAYTFDGGGLVLGITPAVEVTVGGA